FLIFQNMESIKLAQAASAQILSTGSLRDSIIEYAVVRNPRNYKLLYDSNGKQIVSGQYNDISMIGPYFILERDGKKGLADSTGNILLQIIFDGIGNYDNGFMATLRNQKFGLYDPIRGIDIKPQYDIGLRLYNDSLAVVKAEKPWAVDNPPTKTAVVQGRSSLKYVSDNESKQAISSKGTQYGVISDRSLELLPPPYHAILNLGTADQPISFA